MEKIKVAIYTRVSSEEQVKGYSLDSQEEKLVAFCNLQEYEISKKHIFREEGESGAKKSRTQLDKLMQSAKNKEFDLVLVYKLDRFSRNLKNLLELVGELEESGISFKSITETFDTSTPMGKYMLQNMGSIAELEREMIRERMVIGQIKNKEQGNWVSGIAPYGYNYNKETKKLEINIEEAKITKKLFKWLIGEKLSLLKIQQRLNSLKVPTKYDNLGRTKKTNGANWWNKRTIGRILTNEIYTGSFTYNKKKYLGRVYKEENLRPESEWITIKPPSLIDKKTFDLAQAQLNKNKKHSKGNGKYRYLFSRLIKCGECNYSYGSSYEKKREDLKDRRRYFCYGTLSNIKKDTCKSKSISESMIDIPIWNSIIGALSNPALAFKQIEKIQKKENNLNDIKEQLREFEILLSKNKDKENKILELYLEGKMVKDVYLDKLEKTKKDIEHCLNEKSRIENIIISEKEKGLRENSLSDLYERFKNNLRDADYDQKREIIKMLVEKIIIKGKSINIHCNIPYAYSFEGQGTHFHCLYP